MNRLTLTAAAVITVLIAASLAGCGGAASQPPEPKDARTKVEGLPPFEVAFVSDGDVPGLEGETGEVTIDISQANRPDKHLLEAISREALKEVGPASESGYRAALLTYRDAENDYELAAFGVYAGDQEAAEIVNDYARSKGWRIGSFTGEVPVGGYVGATTYYDLWESLNFGTF